MFEFQIYLKKIPDQVVLLGTSWFHIWFHFDRFGFFFEDQFVLLISFDFALKTMIFVLGYKLDFIQVDRIVFEHFGPFLFLNHWALIHIVLKYLTFYQ